MPLFWSQPLARRLDYRSEQPPSGDREGAASVARVKRNAHSLETREALAGVVAAVESQVR